MVAVRKQWIPVIGALAVLLSIAGLVLAARLAAPKAPGDEGAPLSKVRQAATPAPAPGEIDLLNLLRLPEDAIAGGWGFRQRSLVTPLDQFPRVQIPVIPPAEYDLRLTATRVQGTNSLNIGLMLEGRQTMVALDGNDGATSWLFLRHPDGTPNPASHTGRVLRDRQPTRIVCSVRKGGLRVTVEDKTILDWKGDAYDTYLLSDYLIPNPKALLLGSWESSFRIDDLVLVPVTGTPTLLR